MPKVTLHKKGEIFEKQVKDGDNLVVIAGIGKFPQLSYGCGMGRCMKCKAKFINGSEHLNPPNWKEEKLLNTQLEEGYRLPCQLTICGDVELEQP